MVPSTQTLISMKSSTTNNYLFYPDNPALHRAVTYSATVDVDLPGDGEGDGRSADSSAGTDPLQKNTLGNFEHSRYASTVVAASRARIELTLTDELRERDPLKWAAARDHLGVLLATLGQADADQDLLEQAARSFEAALEERHLDNAPLDWAATCCNLGMVLQALGLQRRDAKLFKQSVDAFTRALEGWTRQRAPQQWALAMLHLGTTFYLQGKHLKGSRTFEKSVVAYNNALAEFNPDRDPLECAIANANRGLVLFDLAETEQNADRVREALESMQAGLTVLLEQQQPVHLAVMTRINISAARNLLARMIQSTDEAQQAADELEVVIAAMGNACQPDCIDRAEALLADAEGLVNSGA